MSYDNWPGASFLTILWKEVTEEEVRIVEHVQQTMIS